MQESKASGWQLWLSAHRLSLQARVMPYSKPQALQLAHPCSAEANNSKAEAVGAAARVPFLLLCFSVSSHPDLHRGEPAFAHRARPQNARVLCKLLASLVRLTKTHTPRMGLCSPAGAHGCAGWPGPEH